MRKKRKMRKTNGSEYALRLLICGLLIFAAWTARPGFAADKKGQQPYALIAGTVFLGGFAFPGSEITLTSIPNESSKLKVKKQTAMSDHRGEFAFRVPAAPLQYTLTVKAKGYATQQKSVEIQGEERVDVTFSLEPESKQ